MIVYWMIGHAFPHVRVNLITSTWIDVRLSRTVALAGMVIEKLSRLPDFVGLGSHLYRSPGGDKVQPAIWGNPSHPSGQLLQWSCPVFSRYIVTSFVLRGRLFTHEFVPVSICVDNGPHTLPQGVGHYTWHNLDIYILN